MACAAQTAAYARVLLPAGPVTEDYWCARASRSDTPPEAGLLLPQTRAPLRHDTTRAFSGWNFLRTAASGAGAVLGTQALMLAVRA